MAGHVVIGLGDRGVGEAQGGSGEGRDLARETDHAQRVAAVRLDVDVDDRLADQVGEGRAEGDLVAVAEDVDAVAIGPEAELDRAAQHPVADLAADLRALDPAVTGQDGPDEGGRHELVRLEVLGAAHDLELTAGLADVDACQPQGVRVRMPPDLEDAADDDVGPVRPGGLDGVDLHPAHRQLLGEAARRQFDVDVLAQPGERHAHRQWPAENCEPKRRSALKKSRMSPMPCRSIVIRSGPIPKA